jgi:hypothetical protein
MVAIAGMFNRYVVYGVQYAEIDWIVDRNP